MWGEFEWGEFMWGGVVCPSGVEIASSDLGDLASGKKVAE